MHILLTRPIAQALKTGRRLNAAGHVVSLAPMLEIVFPARPEGVDERFSAIVATSGNAVDGLLQWPGVERLRDVPLYAVGDRTADLARRGGWRKVVSAGGAVDDLAGTVAEDLSAGTGPVLYAAGADRTGDLEGVLRKRGIAVQVAEVYLARPLARLPDAIVDTMRRGDIDLALVYSARTAGILVDCLKAVGLSGPAAGMTIGALSEAVAAPFRREGFVDIVVADRPNERALFEALGRRVPSFSYLTE